MINLKISFARQTAEPANKNLPETKNPGLAAKVYWQNLYKSSLIQPGAPE